MEVVSAHHIEEGNPRLFCEVSVHGDIDSGCGISDGVNFTCIDGFVHDESSEDFFSRIVAELPVHIVFNSSCEARMLVSLVDEEGVIAQVISGDEIALRVSESDIRATVLLAIKDVRDGRIIANANIDVADVAVISREHSVIGVFMRVITGGVRLVRLSSSEEDIACGIFAFSDGLFDFFFLRPEGVTNIAGWWSNDRAIFSSYDFRGHVIIAQCSLRILSVSRVLDRKALLARQNGSIVVCSGVMIDVIASCGSVSHLFIACELSRQVRNVSVIRNVERIISDVVVVIWTQRSRDGINVIPFGVLITRYVATALRA